MDSTIISLLDQPDSEIDRTWVKLRRITSIVLLGQVTWFKCAFKVNEVIRVSFLSLAFKFWIVFPLFTNGRADLISYLN